MCFVVGGLEGWAGVGKKLSDYKELHQNETADAVSFPKNSIRLVVLVAENQVNIRAPNL